MISSTSPQEIAEQCFKKGLTNGQAMIEAYQERRAFLIEHPYWSDGKINDDSMNYARAVVFHLNGLRNQKAEVPNETH